MPRTPVVLYASRAEHAPDYEAAIAAAAADAGLALDLRMDAAATDRADVDYLIFTASGPVQEFAGFTRLKGILNLWAGVEALLALDPPADVPLVRMVERGLTEGMLDYVTGHVYRHHLGTDGFVGIQAPRPWETAFPPLARNRRVTVLGIGALGGVCAQRLAACGFRVTGWSRSQREIPGVRCVAGAEGLGQALDGCEILVLLLPDTPATHHVIDAAAIERLARGACIVNAGRGPLIDDDALLAALDAGRLGHATLDVFDVEPLPEDHPFWAHPKVSVTPHIASVTRPDTAAVSLVEQIARREAGEPFRYVVRRDIGY
ncbi:MAG: glyoxylate/hydroxypyruvate reductase A [Pseudomonadota bacterium]